MIGLEYILELYGVQHKDLAEELGIRKQNINMWMKEKKNIPQKYLPVLAEKYRMPVEYFQKELTDIDKRNIDLLYAEIEVDNTAADYIDVIIDEETGQAVEVPRTYYDSGAMDNYRMKEAELKEAKALNKIRGVINDIPEPETMNEYINMYEGNIELFDRYAKVVEGASYRGDLSYMLSAMEMFNNLSKKLTKVEDIRLKEKLLTIAEQCISDTMMEDNPLPEMMCAIMLLYDKKAQEEAEFWDNHYNP